MTVKLDAQQLAASAIASNDLMFGNGGNDKLCDSEGNDTLYGGKGAALNGMPASTIDLDDFTLFA